MLVDKLRRRMVFVLTVRIGNIRRAIVLLGKRAEIEMEILVIERELRDIARAARRICSAIDGVVLRVRAERGEQVAVRHIVVRPDIRDSLSLRVAILADNLRNVEVRLRSVRADDRAAAAIVERRHDMRRIPWHIRCRIVHLRCVGKRHREIALVNGAATCELGDGIPLRIDDIVIRRVARRNARRIEHRLARARIGGVIRTRRRVLICACRGISICPDKRRLRRRRLTARLVKIGIGNKRLPIHRLRSRRRIIRLCEIVVRCSCHDLARRNPARVRRRSRDADAARRQRIVARLVIENREAVRHILECLILAVRARIACRKIRRMIHARVLEFVACTGDLDRRETIERIGRRDIYLAVILLADGMIRVGKITSGKRERRNGAADRCRLRNVVVERIITRERKVAVVNPVLPHLTARVRPRRAIAIDVLAMVGALRRRAVLHAVARVDACWRPARKILCRQRRIAVVDLRRILEAQREVLRRDDALRARRRAFHRIRRNALPVDGIVRRIRTAERHRVVDASRPSPLRDGCAIDILVIVDRLDGKRRRAAVYLVSDDGFRA